MARFEQLSSALPGTGMQLLERSDVLVELTNLRTALAQGAGHVVALSGEAGIGKTSVLRAFVKSASDDFIILQSGCEHLLTPRPLGPLFDVADMLDPALTDMLVDDEQPGRVLSHVLIAIQRVRKPVIFIIEDIHWADDATLDLVKFLGRRASTLPLLLMVSHRNDEPGSSYSIGKILGAIPSQDVKRLALDPLSPQAVGELAKIAGRDALDIHAVTNGNPFFVTEILASRGDIEIPSSVRDAVWARFEKCIIEQRIALEALSIIPGGATFELLKTLITPPQLEQIDQLIAAGMLTKVGRIIRFRHELARLSIMQLLPESRKRSLHRFTEKWLGNQNDGEELPALAQRIHHANAAGDSETVLALVPNVALRAARMGAHKQAAQFLSLALAHVEGLPADEAAQLYESWSYESGLAERIDDDVIAARHNAIKLWQEAGRTEKVGLNYRWLSRLHWYRGEAEDAKRYIDLAVQTLETVAPGPELAWGYSVKSQWAMLNDQFADAILWGERAKDLAEKFAETEIYVHALNNIGTSLLLSTDPVKGRALMDESLRLALVHQYHEQAARVYTNMAEYALAARDLDMARDYLEKGIAFDTEHDLDSWLHYLRGCHARYLMMQGDLQGAEALARDVLDVPNQTTIMRLPAASVLAQVRARLGCASARDELLDLLEFALATKEPQRIAPIRIALAEAAWLAGDLNEAYAQAKAALSGNEAVQAWDVGELHVWVHRAGQPIFPVPEGMPEPVQLECAGDARAAAEAYGRMGMPFEQAIVHYVLDGGSGSKPLDYIQATMNSSLNGKAFPDGLQRGPSEATRAHPAGLTFKEQQILHLLSEGASNAVMAATLNRSIRTVEHHVSSVLGKLGVTSRSAAVSRAHAEPLLISGLQDG